jgi:hypothetical protein
MSATYSSESAKNNSWTARTSKALMNFVKKLCIFSLYVAMILPVEGCVLNVLGGRIHHGTIPY